MQWSELLVSCYITRHLVTGQTFLRWKAKSEQKSGSVLAVLHRNIENVFLTQGSPRLYPLCSSVYKIAVSVNGNVLEMHKICKREGC